MGGKTSTSSSSTGIPQEVLDRYNAVNAQAQAVAQTPFQQYSQDPSAFVAPLTSTQIAGIQNTNQMAGAAQPFYGAATGLTLAGTGPANAGQIGEQQIGQYMSPYLNSVVGTTMANLRQQQQQEQTGELGNQISRGAFGGDRGRIAQANLARQQNLATGQTVSGLMNQGYGQALQTAQQQQGVNLAAEQANLTRLMQGGQQIAGLGAGAQAAGLQGAQAQLAAGTAEQQTNQAGQTALYNQFLQQQGYPFQVAQFLANIAMGTGALSGQTTTTQQPSSFFSDKRLKEDIEPIGETYDGQKIVKFRYKGESGKQIGLIAQDVEKHHPEAVGLAGGYKTVDYDKATKHAADKGHYLHGGLVPQSEGGAVYEDRAGQGYAAGGETSADMAEILKLLSPQKTRTPYGKAGLYGQSSKAAGPYGSSLGLEDPRGLAVRPVRDLALDDSRYVKAPAFAHGGLAPDGYASGGLPYSEAGGQYVPEEILEQEERKREMLRPNAPRVGAPPQSGAGQIMGGVDSGVKFAENAGKIYNAGKEGYELLSSFFSSGGLVPHMADGGSPDFASLLAMQQAMYGNMPGAKGGAGGLNIPQQMQRKPEMLRPSPMTSAPTESGFKQLTGAAESGAKFGENAEKFYDLSKRGLSGSAGRPELRNQAGQVVREEEKPSTGLISSQKPGDSGYFKQLTDYVSSQFATGGLVPRHGYALDGEVEDGEVFGPPAPEGGPAPAPMTTQEKLREEAAQNRRDAEARDAQRAEIAPRTPPTSRSGVQTGTEPIATKTSELVSDALSYLGKDFIKGEPSEYVPGGSFNPKSPSGNPLISPTPGDVAAAKRRDATVPTGGLDPQAQRALEAEAAALGIVSPAAAASKPVVPIASSAPRIVSSASAAPATTAAAAPADLAPLPPARYVDTVPTGTDVPLAPGLAPVPVNTAATGLAGGLADAETKAKADAEAKAKADAEAKAKEDERKPGLLSRVGDTVTSRDFLVPLLSGLGSMASSPSRYLGSAVLEGLQGGVEASEALRKRSADIAKTESEIVNDSLVSDPVSKLVFQRVFDPKTGTYDFISPMEYQKNKSKYRLSPFAPNEPRGMTAVTAAATPATTQTTAPTAPAAPSSTTVPAGTTTPIYRELPNDQRMNDLIRYNVDRTQFGSVPDPSADPFTDASKRAVEARNNTQNLMTLADALSKSPSGPFQAGVVAPVTKYLNSLSNAVGLGNFFDPETVAKGEVVDKINTQLASMSGQQGTEGYKKLEALKEGIPSNFNSTEGKAALIASILTNNRQAIDEDNFYKLYQKRLATEGVPTQFVQSAGMGLKEEFNRRQAPQYQQEEKVLADLFLKPLRNSSGEVINPSTMSYIITRGGQVPAGFIAAMEKTYAPQYGPGIANRVLRIFGAGE